MTKLTDGNRTIEITMKTWDAQAPGYSPDFSADFFEVGGLPRSDAEVYTVPDVEYCIDAAHDWQSECPDTNTVFVDAV